MDPAKLLALMKDKKQAMKQRDKTVKPQPGKNRIVLLPGWRQGEEHLWFHEFGQHFIKNANDEIQAVYVCLDATYGHSCPVCDALSKAQHIAGDDEMVNLLAKSKSSRSVLVNALMLDSDQPNTPVILEVRRTVFGQLVELVEEWGPDAFKREITITREGKGLNTKYTVQVTPKSYEVPAAVLGKLNNLDEYVKQESEEQQRRAIAAISNVAGLLPASSADKPRTPTRDADDDGFRDVETRGSSASKPAPSNDVALDEELDDLLGDLNTGT